MYLEVNEEHRASAFAFASAAKNVGLLAVPTVCRSWLAISSLILFWRLVLVQVALAVTPLLIGYTRNRSPNYDNVESLLLGGATTTLLLCLLLGCINSNRRGSRGHLNAPTFATIQSPSSVAVRACLPTVTAYRDCLHSRLPPAWSAAAVCLPKRSLARGCGNYA
jgi:hypothetical protein